MRSYISYFALNPLTQLQAEQMITAIAGGRPLPTSIVDQLVARTDGVPLFVEEMTRMVIESGLVKEVEDHYELVDSLAPLEIPTTLHDSLMARLDRLGNAKQTAQLDATLGREFTYEVLAAVASIETDELQRDLSQLVHAELLYQRGVGTQAVYFFKHALIQDAAYQSLLRRSRQRYHQQIAQILEAHFSETCDAQPEWLAYHYSEAGLATQAMTYWQRAIQRAMSRSAHQEAIAHAEQGLAFVGSLPESPERYQFELPLQTSLGTALNASQG